MAVELDDYQIDALQRLKTGSILCGGVGSGKSRTALAYFLVKECNGSLNNPSIVESKPLYIITTARKRDDKEWEDEFPPFPFDDIFIKIDSWNNIGKYKEVEDAFFIFDEQRVVGSGAWVKAFLRITKRNNWILLSATPGDTWTDYIPVFIANGFYKNKTEFITRHVVYSRFAKYPKVDHYIDTGRLLKHRRDILVNMDYKKPTRQHHETIFSDYDKELYKSTIKTRWNPYLNEPLRDMAGLCYILRKIVNSDPSRTRLLSELVYEYKKAIIFYNFDYELEILRQFGQDYGVETAEWNGHRHMPLPTSDEWIYLVQYTAGAEGWNCTSTNVIIFYSQNYSYKAMVQAAGRIDRRNTPYTDLYYFHMRSHSSIDIAIHSALSKKKNFNERGFNVT